MAFVHSPKIVTDGLVLALDAGNVKSYPGSGTTWSDKSGNGNDGTLTNGPTFDSGNGGSIVFDGVDDYVDFGDILSITSSFSLNIWFKSNPTQPSVFLGLMAKDALNNFGNYGLFGSSPSEYVRFGFYGTNEVQYQVFNSSYQDLLSETWVNYTGTYDFSKLRLYRNSILIAEENSTSTPKTNTTPLTIGTRYANSLEFGGRIPIAQIYNRSLTSNEVAQNYNATKGRFGL